MSLAFDALLHQRREGAGAADGQSQLRIAANRVEPILQCIDGFALRQRIEAGSIRVYGEQRLIPRARKPDVIKKSRLCLGLPGLQKSD